MVTLEQRKIRVLVVDDKPNMVRMTIHMLQTLGFQNIVKASDGDVAMQKLKGGESIDLILCDWNMPRMTGIEVLRAIKEDEHLREIPFLMVTAEVDPKTVAEAGEVEVDSYLLKPFRLEDLQAKIEEVLNKKYRPSPIDVHVNLAQVHKRAGQFEQAENELREALKLSPRSPRVSFALGQLYEAKGDQNNARKLYQRAVEFGPMFLNAH